MRQAVFTPEHGFVVMEAEVPTPGPGEVLVRVSACGICGSDRQLVHRGAIPPGTRFPLVMGHEICGTVADDGGTSRFTHGERVVVMPYVPCGTCRMCQTGQENLCSAQQLIGYHRAGGLAEYVSVPEAAVLRCPDTVNDVAAAVLVDAFATPFHAIRAVMRPVSGESILVQGFGGTGQAAVRLLAAMGHEMAVVTHREDAAKAAEAAGARAVFVSSKTDHRLIARAIRRWSTGGVDAVLDTIGSEESIQHACDLVRPGGRICVIGLHDSSIVWPLAKAVRRGVGLLGSFSETREDAELLLEWAVQGRIFPEQLVGNTYRLESVAEAFAEHASGRAVIVS
jgi:alcohol dehydrogenase, propanol-preferring